MAEIINKELSDYQKSLIEEGKLTYDEAMETQQNNKVKIGYKEYEIVKKEEIIELPNECYGRIDFDKEKIELSTKYNQNQQNQTFLHELIHGIFDKLDMHDLRDNETVVNQLSKELYEVVLDNPHIFTMKDI